MDWHRELIASIKILVQEVFITHCAGDTKAKKKNQVYMYLYYNTITEVICLQLQKNHFI